MKSTAQFALRGLAVTLCLLIASAAQAGFLGASATLDQLSSPGMSIGASGYTFTDFSLTNSAVPSNKDIDPEDMSVSVVPKGPGKVDLLFQFQGVWTEGDFTELVLDFTAWAPDGQAIMSHGLSFGPSFIGDLSGSPYATINETVMPMDPNSTQAPYTLVVFRDPQITQLIDSQQVVTPANKLVISKDFQVYGGDSEEPTRVILTDFRQSFMTVVPEPNTVVLLLTGVTGLGLTAALRRRG
ncbi:MAG: hypothetical protein CMJ58_06725 [Planctomycetaceae bacterium]|nr:hypothetical protein [Planctomycetaceae bacterium]